MTPGMLIVLLVIGVLVVWVVYQQNGGFKAPTLEIYPREVPAPQPPPIINIRTGDDRYSMSPRPQQLWNNGPEYPVRGALPGLVPLNVPTRGLPEAYQSMGIVKTEDGQMLPLYGRRVASRSDRFNYYTRTDTYNPVSLPITFKRRDCQDDVGCDELSNGDSVNMASGKRGEVSIYRFDGPMYVPGLI
jgi:hypothetical protein